jgi:hypothetical protein
VVVQQAYQSLELLVKGMICLTGHAPRVTHNTDLLIGELLDNVSPTTSEEPRVPFAVFASSMDGGNGYGVWLYDASVEIVKVISRTFTAIAHFSIRDLLRADAILCLGLEVKDFTMRLILDGEPVFVATDSSVSGPLTLRREFVREPSMGKVTLLKEIGRKLRLNRESSFYAERTYAKTEAAEAMRLFDDANEVATCFLVEEHERISVAAACTSVQQGTAVDCLQRPLLCRSRFRQRLTAGVRHPLQTGWRHHHVVTNRSTFDGLA